MLRLTRYGVVDDVSLSESLDDVTFRNWTVGFKCISKRIPCASRGAPNALVKNGRRATSAKVICMLGAELRYLNEVSGMN